MQRWWGPVHTCDRILMLRHTCKAEQVLEVIADHIGRARCCDLSCQHIASGDRSVVVVQIKDRLLCREAHARAARRKIACEQCPSLRVDRDVQSFRLEEPSQVPEGACTMQVVRWRRGL